MLTGNSLMGAMIFLTLTGLSIPALAGAGEGSFFKESQSTTWQPSFSTGLEAYTHTYSLSTTDTTESLAEFMASAALTGRSSRRAVHRWRLHAEGSAGTELFRQTLEAQYRYQVDGRTTRLRLDGVLRGRQYRQSSEYSLTSDNSEGRLDLRAYPLVGVKRLLELRGWADFMNFQKPSTLEVDYHDEGVGLFLKSSGLEGPVWSLGSRQANRSYPDSTRIDRRTLSLEGHFDIQDYSGQLLRFYHKSERRHIRDETARPSGWSHWTDFAGQVQAGPGLVFLDLLGEVWRYDSEFSAYNNSWRAKAVAGYTWGDALSAAWKLGLATEKLEVNDNPESYTEVGLRAGVEAYGGPVSGSVALEMGSRRYRDGTVYPEDFAQGNALAGEEPYALYTDFTYWEIWLTATWQLNSKVSLDILASFEPENHTEQADDATLGFANIRLVYRP